MSSTARTSPSRTSTASPPRQGSGRVEAAYRWALGAFLTAGVVQIFLAGLGVFSLHGKELGKAGETALDPHRTLGFALGALAVAILVLAVVARAGRGHVVLSAVAVLLANLAQSLLADLGEEHPLFGGLHALDGLAVLGIAGYLLASASARHRAGAS